MKNFKRFTAAAMCMLFAVTALSGCKKEAASNTTDISNAEVLTENKMPIANGDVTLSIWLQNNSQGYLKSYADAKSMKVLQERTGINLDFQHPTGAVSEQLNIMLASGDLPDLIYYTWKFRKKDMQNGLFLNLSEYIEKWAPNFRKLLEENPHYKEEYHSTHGMEMSAAFPTVVDDEKFMCYDGYFMRKDWLDKLGLSVPETIEEWEEVLTAFKEKDPNGNGKQDEIGFSTLQYMTKYVFMPAFGICINDYYRDPKTGKVTHAALQPGYKDYLETMNRWYKKGLVNPSYLTTARNELDAMVLNDELGAFHCDNNNSMPKYMQGNHDMELVAVPFPKSPDGKHYTSQTSIKQLLRSNGTLISSSCKNVYEAVRLLDYLYSEEGKALMNWGIEGESYEVDKDGNKHFTDLIMNNPEGKTPYEAIAAYFPNTGFTGFNSYLASSALEGKFNAKLKKVKEDSVNYSLEADKGMILPNLPTTIEEDEEISNSSADLSTYMSEMYSKFIMGVEPLDNFDEFQKNIKKLGIEKVIEIKQKAYDRLQKG